MQRILTQQEMRSTTASVRTMESQLATIVGTMRQVEHAMEKTAEARLSVLHWIEIFGFGCFSLFGFAAGLVFLWQRFGG